jgi:hypothetical protein
MFSLSKSKRNSAALRLCVRIFFPAALLLLATAAHSDNAKPKCACAAYLQLTGMQNTAPIFAIDMRKFPSVTVFITQRTDHGDVVGTFSGPLLWTVLDNAGWVNGTEKNAYLRHTILVTGKDGYAAALSEGEIDPKLEGKQVILAMDEDGKPLDGLHLVVPGDAHASRSVHNVVSIEVK